MPPEDQKQEELEYTYYLCPEENCVQIATLEWTDIMSTETVPVEIGKIRCALGHWFMMPTQDLEYA